MIAAIYARKSTEQKGISEEDLSVTRQVALATAFADELGATVEAHYIFIDDGISGAEFKERHALQRLLKLSAQKPRPFDVLIVRDETRLGREQIETSFVFKTILDAGIRVYFYSDKRERTFNNALEKVMFGLLGFASEMKREKTSLDTYEKMKGQAEAGHVTGGAVYGYENVEILAPTLDRHGRPTRLHVLRRINPEQAAVVQRIFALCAEGNGFTKIAKALNADRIPPPRKDGHGWAPSGIREMLYRPLYRGELIWNRLQRVERNGTAERRRRPAAEWLHLPVPDLRIVPEELWIAAHDRLTRTRIVYARASTDGRLLGRPTRLDLDSPYLLSGMARCTTCGGAVIAMTRGRKVRGRYYGCAYHYKRGATICSNNVQIRQQLLDEAVLHAIATVLDERLLETAVNNALAQLRGDQAGVRDRRTRLEQEIGRLEARERHLVDAIAQGEAVQPLLDQLKQEGVRKAALTRELQALPKKERTSSLEDKLIAKDLKALAADIRNLLTTYTPQARQMLRKLLIDRLDVTPFHEEGQKGYRFTGQGNYSLLLAGKALPLALVPGAGIEPAREFPPTGF